MSGIGHEPPTLTIDEQVELLEHRLADQDLVTQHQSLLECVPAFQLDDEGSRYGHGFPALIGVLGHLLPPSRQPQTSGDLGRHHCPNRPGVDERIRLERPDLLRGENSAPDEILVDRVREPRLDPHLTHRFHRITRQARAVQL
jgi:hypothetical protein